MSGDIRLSYLHRCCSQMSRGTSSFSLSLSLSPTHTRTLQYVYMCAHMYTRTHVAVDCNKSPSWNLCLSRHICGTGDLADQAHFCTNHNIIRGCHLQYAAILRIVLREERMFWIPAREQIKKIKIWKRLSSE